MRIEEYTSSQYAGTTNQHISFAPGMNVVLGDNEAGKSTMIAGIRDTLWMPAKLDKRRDKSFLSARFPVNTANIVDGEVRLTLSGQEVTVKKEWTHDKTGRTELRYQATGARVVGPEAEKQLKQLLSHGEAMSDNVIFGRQDTESAILDWFFQFLNQSDSTTEERGRVADAVAAAGGISEEIFFQKLKEKLVELGGHWDFDRDQPERGKKWEKGKGTVLIAYETWQDACGAHQDAEQAISQAEAAEKQLVETKREQQQITDKQSALQREQADLQQIQAAVQNYALLQERRKTLTGEREKFSDAKKEWRRLESQPEYLKQLKAEKDEQSARQKRDALKKELDALRQCSQTLADCRAAMAGKEEILTDAETYKKLIAAAEKAEIRLSSAQLCARVALEQGYSASVETADGITAQNVSQFAQDIRGYAKVTIPGVGTVTVTPKEIDADKLKQEIAANRGSAQAILDKYAVHTAKELETAADQYQTNQRTCENQEGERIRLLHGRTEEELAGELAQIPIHDALPVREDLNACIEAACRQWKKPSLEICLDAVTTQWDALRETYGSPENIDDKLQKADNDLRAIETQLAGLDANTMTPAEYKKKAETLSQQMESLPREAEALGKKAEMRIGEAARLKARAEALDLPALREEEQKASQEFERQKSLWHSYDRIKTDFERLQDDRSDQYSGFYERLNDYLRLAGENALAVLDRQGVKSGANLLKGKEYLSEGTRKLLLLAFRLALVQSCFDEEGGVIVLDDILLDMDPNRRAGAARLLAEFSKQNQVIFTTCDPAIAALLGGNHIQMPAL